MEQENKEVIRQENKETERPFSERLAMEMLHDENNKHKTKNLGLWILGGITAIALITSAVERKHLIDTNLQNDQEWRELFSQYDYVSQDGGGINSINTGEQGDLNNGATSENQEGRELEGSSNQKDKP